MGESSRRQQAAVILLQTGHLESPAEPSPNPPPRPHRALPQLGLCPNPAGEGGGGQGAKGSRQRGQDKQRAFQSPLPGRAPGIPPTERGAKADEIPASEDAACPPGVQLPTASPPGLRGMAVQGRGQNSTSLG